MIKSKERVGVHDLLAEKLLLVKILFEVVSFEASFEGREGRAVTKSERKRIPDVCCKEAEGTITMLFSSSCRSGLLLIMCSCPACLYQE